MSSPFQGRVERVCQQMVDLDIDVLMVSVGPDLPWLTGYEAMPLERLTMLVLTAAGDCTLVVPALEAPRVVPRSHVSIRAYSEGEDPISLVIAAASAGGGSPAVVAFGDRTWSRFLIDIQDRMPSTRFTRSNPVTGPLRAVKDPHEMQMLRRASAAVDRIAARLQAGDIELVGRTEADVSADLGRRIIAEGHVRVNFAIVASGPNAASPHHEAGDRIIQAGEVVLCDFGGTMHDDWGVGYCSDITRCVWTGPVPDEAAAVYNILQQAQAAGLAAGVNGVSCEAVDRACRDIIEAGGYGEFFIHRTGHGIGVEEHEDPYMVAGNLEPIRTGHAYSVEPGIYLPGRFGFRLEDIVIATDHGPEPINAANHDLIGLG